MKMSDLKVGDVVGYKNSTYALPVQVTVLETGLRREVWNGWRYQTGDKKDGVRIEHASGTKEVVPNTRLHPWEALVAEADASRAAQQRREEWYSRARHAADAAMIHAGVNSGANPTYGKDYEVPYVCIETSVLEKLIGQLREFKEAKAAAKLGA